MQLTRCEKKSTEPEEPELPLQLLVNGDFEGNSTDPWYSYAPPGEGFSHALTNSVYHSPTHAVSITRTGSGEASNFAHWTQLAEGDFSEYYGCLVELKCRVKTDHLLGDGILLIISGSNANSTATIYATTQGNNVINGTHDWRECTASTLISITDLGRISVFLLMTANSMGTAYLDDVSLTIREYKSDVLLNPSGR